LNNAFFIYNDDANALMIILMKPGIHVYW